MMTSDPSAASKRPLTTTSPPAPHRILVVSLVAVSLGAYARAAELSAESAASLAAKAFQGAEIILASDSPISPLQKPPQPPALGRRRFAESHRFNGDERIKVAFFDADSTLRVSISGSVSANGPKDAMLLPRVGKKLAELSASGFLIVIVSNQGGVPQHISLEDADAALSYTVRLIREQGGEVHYYDFAEKQDGDRKPQTGMATRLEKLLQERFGVGVRIERALSFMVGDSAYKRGESGKPGDLKPDGTPGTHFSNSDRLFAESLGIAFFEPADFFGWRRFGVDVFSTKQQVDAFLQTHPNP